MLRNLVCTVLLLGLFAGSGPVAASDGPMHRLMDPSVVDGVVDEFVSSGAFPFVYVRLEDRNGKVIYEHSAADADLMGGMDISGDSWIRIWSMSKIVTIATTLDLVEDGVLSLDDPVVKYIPEFAALQVALSASGGDLLREEDKDKACPLRHVAVESAMTVRDLLNHKAGFYYPWTGMECLDGQWSQADLLLSSNSDELIERLVGLPLINQPGTDYNYSTATTVLGLVAERASGLSLNQLVQDRVTGPLGIHGLQYGLPEGAVLPPRFVGTGGQARRATAEEMEVQTPDYTPSSRLFLGGEGMVATADGYADFARMLLRRGELNGHRVLERDTVEEIASPHTQLDNPYGYNGYNLWVSNGKLFDGSQGPAPLWIGGGYEGTHFWIDPVREFVGVVMTQILDVPESGNHRDEKIRQAIYAQLEEVAAE